MLTADDMFHGITLRVRSPAVDGEKGAIIELLTRHGSLLYTEPVANEVEIPQTASSAVSRLLRIVYPVTMPTLAQLFGQIVPMRPPTEDKEP